MSNFLSKAKMNVKNHKAAWYVGTVSAAATALVLFARSCGPMGEGPTQQWVRNDGICHEMESSPYQRDKASGKVLCQRAEEAPQPTGTVDQASHAVSCPQGSAPVRNPYYSKEDCFYGDNVCDSQADPREVRDPAGNMVQWIAGQPSQVRRADAGPGGPATAPGIRYTSGREVSFPLEGPASVDCMLQQVREHPCADYPAYSEANPPVQRPRFTFPPGSVDERTRQRTQEEIESMHAHPETLRTGGNYFTVYVGYEESCDRTFPLCTAESTAQCWCPNIQECAPAPPPAPRACGNGRADPGEKCDYRDRRRPRGGCEEGSSCSRRCQCVQDAPGARCGNNRREGAEECDGNDSSSCGASGQCNSQCMCEDRPPVQGDLANCPFDAPPSLSSRIRDSLTGNAVSVRSAVGAATSQGVNVSVVLHVDANGVPTVQAARGSCTSCSGGDVSSFITIGAVRVPSGQECRLRVNVTVAPG